LLLLLQVGVLARADEGMWLLQIMQEQHSIDMMKKAGLNLNAADIYNPNGVSLKDAVGIFGGGCTGEIISADGLILTNHHCGYESIQQLSSVEHDYLKNGFWSKSRNQELPVQGLEFRFVDKIVDVTDRVNADIKAKKVTEAETITGNYCNKLAGELKASSEYKGKDYIQAEVLPFYAGNCFYVIYYKIYNDVRMVAAPPSSIGKFGGETDNWMWPRHTGDFSMFRIYADKNGEPAAYNKDNTPLHCKKHLTISLQGIKEGDYAMIMGFPGSTSRYLTVSEVKERMKSENDPRIKVRTAYLDVLKKAMAASDKTRIQYASKFAMSSNYWKNSIGMNKAIVDNKVLDLKAQQERAFESFAKNKPEYQGVVAGIDSMATAMLDIAYNSTTFDEVFGNALEFTKVVRASSKIPEFEKLFKSKDKNGIDEMVKKWRSVFDWIHDKDYDETVDANVAKALLPLYAEMVPESNLPDIYQTIKKEYKGDYNKFVDDMFSRSIFASEANFNAFASKPTMKAINKDLGLKYGTSVLAMAKTVNAMNSKVIDEDRLAILHKKYIRGLNEMNQPRRHIRMPTSPFASLMVMSSHTLPKTV
jgi:hypothetical protein